jgi:hypothetical protein
MIGEVALYGVFIPILLVWAVLALAVMTVLRRVLAVLGFYRLVWHRPLVELSLFVIILAAVAAVFPRWL